MNEIGHFASQKPEEKTVAPYRTALFLNLDGEAHISVTLRNKRRYSANISNLIILPAQPERTSPRTITWPYGKQDEGFAEMDTVKIQGGRLFVFVSCRWLDGRARFSLITRALISPGGRELNDSGRASIEDNFQFSLLIWSREF